MSFVSGTGIGPYLIEREIGRGGMGVVYLARDPRLDRNVAIKALPDHLATDPARLERFEIEARSLAQLNHPNVAGILGLEEKDGQKFLILEYVEGESLAERLGHGSLSVEEALGICVQIVAGVEAAHEAGVIHRDLKPDNIRITPEDEVKVLDFGLAKITESSSTAGADAALHDAPTLTTPQRHSPTMTGMIMGTAAYMSPEQARGRPVDKRTDIWSFGVVLYECLSGAGPFAGETAGDSIGAILHKDVDLARLPESTPPMVKHVLGGCLERDLSHRYRDIGDVRIELERARSSWGETPDEPRPGPARLAVVGLVLATAVVAAAAAWFGKPVPPPTPLPVVNTEISLPEGRRMAHYFHSGITISPDGQTLAFFYGDEPGKGDASEEIHPRGIMLRRLDQPGTMIVPGPEMAGTELVFAPDGEWLAFSSHDALHKVPVTGGQPTKIAAAPGTCGLAWGDDRTIVAGLTQGGLVRFPSTGGAVDTLTTLDPDAAELSHRLPHVLPGSDIVLFTVLRYGYQLDAPGAWSVWALRLSTGTRTLLIEHASDARHVNGFIVFVREGSLFAVSFDPGRLVVTGTPRLVLDGVQHSIYVRSLGFETGAGRYAISSTGTLAYVPGTIAPEGKGDVIRVDSEGNETDLDIEPRQYHNRRGSPDGSRLLLSSYYAPTSSVWIHDFERGVSRLQRSGGSGIFAIWGPGPDRITYDRKGDDGRVRILTKPVGGTVADEVEIELPKDTMIWISEWSRDGNHLIGANVNDRDLWSYTSGSGWAPIMVTDGAMEGWPSLSPDGRWLAYGSTESGRTQILVRPFPGPGTTVQVSRHGGTSPAWSRDGSELLFRGRDADGERWIMAAGVTEAAGRLEIDRARPLFEDNYSGTYPIRSWDALADGDFVFGRLSTDEQRQERLFGLHANSFRVVQNWASTLD